MCLLLALDQSDGRSTRLWGRETAEVLVFSHPESALPLGVSKLSRTIPRASPQRGLGTILWGLVAETDFLGTLEILGAPYNHS